MSRAYFQFPMRFLLAFLVLLLVSTAIAVGEAPTPAPATTASPSEAPVSVQYRRIYVPADKMDAWPREKEKLIPIEVREFDELIQSTENIAANRENSVAISAAEYSAQLDANGMLRGTGRWTISHRGDKPGFLSLGDTSLVLQNLRWNHSPQQAVRIGNWAMNDQASWRFGLEVLQAGTLEFDFHVPVQGGDQLEIPWRVPMANSNRLILDLPDGKQPRIEGGVVLESLLRPSDDKTPARPLRRWVLAVPPAQRTGLQIISADRKTSNPISQTILDEEIRYQIGPRGLEMTASWNLKVPMDQKRELAVAVPPGLQLSSIKASTGELSWRLLRDTSLPTDTIIIDLPKTDGVEPIQITFSAWQPLVLGAPWRLPRFRAEGVFWSSGKLDLSVAATHELTHLVLTDCVETKVGRLNANEDAPETHSFTEYSSSGALEINLSERQPDTVVRAGSSLTLADPNLNGRLASQFTLSHGATHQLVGNVAPGWIVEALETIPADAMTEWFIDKNGGEQTVEVQLSRAARATQDITVIVTARLQRFNLNERLSADTMRMIHWKGAKNERHLLAFQSGDPYTVIPVGKLAEMAGNAIDVKDQSLLDTTSESKIFDVTSADKGAGLQFAVQRGEFAARLAMEGTYENESLRIDYQLTAEPESGPIDRVLVYATSPLGDATRWVEKATGQVVPSEKLAANDPQRLKLPEEGEAWLLRLAPSTTHAIELVATANLKRLDNTSLPLLCFPEAKKQEATIAIRSRNVSALWLDPTHVQTIPAPSQSLNVGPSGSLPAVYAAYRYQPVDCLNPVQFPKLAATLNRAGVSSPLVARYIELESFFWPDGKGTHRATYHLDGHGAAEIKVALPPSAAISSASLDNQSLELAKATGQSQLLVIRLAGQTSASRLSLFFETRETGLAAGRKLSPPNYVDNISFIAGDWTIFLPEEYSVTNDAFSTGGPVLNWRERLFGVFGRPTGSHPFNPFRLADKAAFADGNANGSLTGRTIAASVDEQPTTKLSSLPSSTPIARLSTSGWHRFKESFAASEPAPVVVLHPPAMTAWAVALMLTCFALGRWIRRKSSATFAIALATAAGLALLLPITHVDLASGAVLGLLLSLVVDLPRREATPSSPASSMQFGAATTLALAFLLALAFARFGYADVLAGDPPLHESTTNKIHRLFIPTDDKGKPTGNKYFLSDEFLKILIEHSASGYEAPGDWILNGAKYSGELSEQMGQKSVTGGSWILTFAIETLSRDATIVLPLVQSEADWSPTAMLDGVPLPIEWRDSGRSCTIQVPEPGRYSLSLTCTPKTTTAEGLAQIDLAIPPIPGARVDVRYPEDASGVSVAKASAISGSNTERTVRAELDRANRLIVRWSHADKSAGSTTGLSISEMRWLHVTPTALELTIKCILEGSGRRPDSLVFSYNNQWSLQTSPKSLNAKTLENDDTGEQSTLRVPIASQSSDRQEISVRWRLERSPQLGNFRLPSIELTSVAPSKRWLAISSDPAFECEVPDSSAIESTSNEFFAKWGAAEIRDPPQTVLSNFSPNNASSLSIRPRETEPIVDESLSILADIKTLRVSYEMRATPGLPGTYRTELSVPTELVIEDVAVTEADQSVPIRWSRSANSRVSIFLGEEATKPYRLVLNGKLALDTNGKAPMPRLSSLSTDDATLKTYIYRSDGVEVDFEGLASSGDPKAEAPGPAPSQWSARPVGTCYLESGASLAKIVVQPVETKIAGDTLTSLSRENNSWWMGYRCQLSVDGGDLDLLRVRVPDTVTGPFEIQSASAITSEFKSVDSQPGTLTIRLATSVPKGGTLDLRIRSPLKPPTGGMISAPLIEIESLAGGHRYLAVPGTIESQVVTWNQSGVRPATIPPKLRTGFVLPNLPHAFEVTKASFQMISKPSAAKELVPSIRLADTTVLADSQGAQRITTRLIVAPHGLTDCVLQLPPQQSLITAEIDGRPAMTRQLDPSQWRLALWATQLPQAIEIVSRRSATAANANTIDLQRPTLTAHGNPIMAEISLWSFAHPENSQLRIATGADEVTTEDQSALRFDRLISIAEAAKSTAIELLPTDGYNWYQPWAKLLSTAREQARQVKKLPLQGHLESQVSRTTEDQISQAAARLDKWLKDCRQTFADDDSLEATPITDAAKLITAGNLTAEPSRGTWTHYVAEGGDNHLMIHLQPQGLTLAQARLLGTLLIGGLLVASLWILRQPGAADILFRWPHALGVVIGIGYWAWMWPSWFGLVIAAVSLWLALRFHWPGRSIRTEASTVLRNARST